MDLQAPTSQRSRMGRAPSTQGTTRSQKNMSAEETLFSHHTITPSHTPAHRGGGFAASQGQAYLMTSPRLDDAYSTVCASILPTREQGTWRLFLTRMDRAGIRVHIGVCGFAILRKDYAGFLATYCTVPIFALDRPLGPASRWIGGWALQAAVLGDVSHQMHKILPVCSAS